MKNFEYSQPRSEREIVAALADFPGETEILAGGTDLVGLMKRNVVAPRRVVNVLEVESLQHIEEDGLGRVWVGAAVHLDTFLEAPLLDRYPAPKQILNNMASPQRRAQGTLGGELCRRPACWYFRGGHGLLAEHGHRIETGDNRYHAILANDGPAKFVSASRLAPSLIAAGAEIRVIGPADEETFLPLANLYRVPEREGERESTLQPGQAISHVILPPDEGQLAAAYEVRHGVGPDPPLAAAAVSLQATRGIVQHAQVVLGHVAPVPWVATATAGWLVGQPLDRGVAAAAGRHAVAKAKPLTQNEYKIQLAAVAVERAILTAVGQYQGDI